MTSLFDLIAMHCRDGVPYRAIQEIADCYSGATPSLSVSQYWEDGIIPWLSSGEVNKGTIYETNKMISQAGFDSCSTRMVPPKTVLLALAGQGRTRGSVARTRISLCTNQSLCSIVCTPEVDSDFLFYFLQTQYQQLRTLSSGDGSRGGLNLKMIRSFRIPVPPIQVQREIAATLDRFASLQDALHEELASEVGTRISVSAHFRDQIISGSEQFEAHRLEDVVEFANGKAQERIVDPDGDVALMTARFVSTGGTVTRRVRLKDALTLAQVGDVAMVMSDLPRGRALARCFLADKENAYSANQRVCLLRVKRGGPISPRFLYHYLNRNKQLLAHDNGQDQTHLKKGDILGVMLPIPPLEIQDLISNQLEFLSKSVIGLTEELALESQARRKQYEYYRDKLLTFKEMGV